MRSTGIKYRYAIDADSSIVDVTELTSNDRGEYLCLGCDKIVIPILGKVRRKHFRHQTVHECSQETYLHKMGKLLFQQRYEQCLENNIPYEIKYSVPVFCNHCGHGDCQRTPEIGSFDLTTVFKTITSETKDGNFIPDLIVKSANGDKIYIEIAVTHKCSYQKRASGERIIEFAISAEEDLSVFSRTCLESFDGSLVSFLNFHPEPVCKPLPEQCDNDISFLVVYPNGKCAIQKKKIFIFDEFCHKNEKLYIQKVSYGSFTTFLEAIEKAYHAGAGIKNCYLCRHHSFSAHKYATSKDKKIFCKVLQTNKSSNDAADCVKYHSDPNFFASKRQRDDSIAYELASEWFPKISFHKKRNERVQQQHQPAKISKKRGDIFRLPEYVTCSICGKRTNVWTCLKPAKCTDCVNSLPLSNLENNLKKVPAFVESGEIPSNLLKNASELFTQSNLELLYFGTGQKMLPVQVWELKKNYNSVDKWYASLKTYRRENVLEYLKKVVID